MSLNSPKQSFAPILIILLILGTALGVTYQFLGMKFVPLTPTNDLAMHVGLVENFMIALRSGQFFPIIQSPPDPIHPDLPVFLYYGFMHGLVSIPGIALSLSSLNALMLGILGARVIGGLAIYFSGRLLCGNRLISVIAALAYFMTPYVISNLYGRVAIAEALAHCEIPFLVLGLLLAKHNKKATGAAVTAVTLLFLALTHPIFLLYGSTALLIMMIASLSRQVFISGATGLISGILLSTFRWYPALVSSNMFDHFARDPNPDINGWLTSWQGLYSIPLSLGEMLNGPNAPFEMTDKGNTTYLYLTPSWITIPCILMLITYLARKNKNYSTTIMILAPSCIFFILAYAVFSPFSYLPEVFWRVQFPYRLLAFVALFTALSLPLLLPKIRYVSAAILVMIIVFQSWNLIHIPTYTTQLDILHERIKTQFSNNDYLIRDTYSIASAEGDLKASSTRIYPITYGELFPVIIPNEGYRLNVNRKKNKQKQFIEMVGYSGINKGNAKIWLEDGNIPGLKIVEKNLTEGPFHITLPLPESGDQFLIKAAEGTSSLNSLVKLESIDIIPKHTIKSRWNIDKPQELRAQGVNTLKENTEIWIAYASDPSNPLTGKILLKPGPFDFKLNFPEAEEDLVLISTKSSIPSLENPDSKDNRKFNLKFNYADIASKNSPLQVPIKSHQTILKKAYPYSRIFTVNPTAWWDPSGKTQYPGIVQLPISFNPFYVAEQQGKILDSKPDESGLINIRTTNLADPIIVKFRLPVGCYLLPILGILILIFFRIRCAISR